MSTNARLDVRRSVFCPSCRSHLGLSTDEIVECPTCQHRVVVREGIPMVGEDSTFYYDEIPLETMERFLSSAREGEFEAALDTITDPDLRLFIIESHFAPTRGSWIFTTALDAPSENKRALDFGCGWGVNSIALAPFFDEVVGIDLSWHRLVNLRSVCQAQAIENVTAVCGGDTAIMPFPDDYFDLVVLNGVIEWIPVGQAGDPREAQVRFLREIARITKSAGELFMASENRYAYSYWAGRPDDHTGLRFGSLLPRPLANVYSRIKRHKAYQNYTYSVGQYRRLLREADFPHVQFFGMTPTHRLFTKIFPLQGGRILDREESRASRLKDSLLRSKLATPLASVIASRSGKTPPRPSFVERLCEVLQGLSLVQGTLEPRPYKLVATNFCAKAGIRTQGNADGVLVRIPLTKTKAQLVENALCQQQAWQHNDRVGRYISPILRAVELDGCSVTVENLWLGAAGRHPRREEAYRQVSDVLAAFADAQTDKRMLEVWVQDCEGLLRYADPKHRRVVDRVANADALQHVKCCFHHGDLHWDNVILGKGQRLRAIVDWEWATPDGIPLSDLFHVVGKHDDIGLGGCYFSNLEACARGDYPHSALGSIAERLLKVAGLTSSDIPSLIIIYLYHTLTKRWLASASYNLDRKLLNPIERHALEQTYRLAERIV